MAETHRVLVVLPSWVGDVVMATPALRAIRAAYPAAEITYLQRPYIGELLAGCRWFDRVEHWPEGASRGWGATLALVRRLRNARPDAAILFPNSFRSAAVAWLAGASRRIGYARDGRGRLLTQRLRPVRDGRKFKPLPMLDYYRDLAVAAGCPVDSDRLELHTTPPDEAALDQRLGPDDGKPIVVLNPGAAYGVAKCWPAERYAAVADHFAGRGFRVVASCTPAERDVAERLRAAVRAPLTLFADPPLGLGPLKALVRRAALMITNDTGPRHFAAAFNVPVVTVFGSSDPEWTHTRHPLERLVKVSLDCQPCMQRTCPLGHHQCMKDVTAAMVASAAEGLLAQSRGDAVARLPAART